MNVSYNCPGCQHTARCEVSSQDRRLVCADCSQAIEFSPKAIEGRRLTRCLACPSVDLYVRKDFPQRLGVALVAVGIIGSCIAWAQAQVIWTFAILFATALVDVVLYFVVGDALMCYRCGAVYRDVEQMEAHGPFDLETHERYRQAAARMKEASSGR